MDDFIVHLQEMFAGLGRIHARRMFGGYGIYHDRVMFALVSDNTLYLKADAEMAGEFVARGLPPFSYSKAGKTVTMSYYLAPEVVLEDPEEALAWGRRALEAALRTGKGSTP